MGNNRINATDLTTAGLYSHYRSGSGSDLFVGIDNLNDNLSTSNISNFDKRLSDAVNAAHLGDGSHTVRLSDVPARFTGGEADTVGRFRADITVNVTVKSGQVTIQSGRWSQHAPDPYDFKPEWGDRGPGLRGFIANMATWLENRFEQRDLAAELSARLATAGLSGQFTKEQLQKIVGEMHFSKSYAVSIEGERALDLGKCFAAGTLILTTDGVDISIEKIRAGDMVASFDEHSYSGRSELGFVIA